MLENLGNTCVRLQDLPKCKGCFVAGIVSCKFDHTTSGSFSFTETMGFFAKLVEELVMGFASKLGELLAEALLEYCRRRLTEAANSTE